METTKQIVTTVDEILVSWGFPDLIDVFKEQEIDLEALLALDCDTIKDLIPKAGPRIKFFTKLKQQRDLMNIPVLLAADVNTENFPLSPSVAGEEEFVITSPESSKSSSDADDNSIIIDDSLTSINNAFEKATKRKFAFVGEQNFKKACRETYSLALKSFLEQTLTGKFILNAYQHNGQLTRKMRGQLTHILISGLMSHSDNDGRLLSIDFEILAEKIVDLFPTETSSTYYIPRVPGTKASKPVNARGKLVDKYRNLRRLYTLPDESVSELDSSVEGNDTNINYDALQEHMIWLKQNDQPWQLVIENWNRTFPLRRNNSKRTVTEYILDWPIIKHKDAYELIKLDFHRIFPECKISSLITEYDQWEKFYTTLKNLYEIKDKTTQEFLSQLCGNINQDSKNSIQIASLPLIFPPKVRINYKKSSQWKPSTVESREGLIQIVDSYAKVDEAIAARQEKFKVRQLPVQPYLIVTGACFADVTDTFVVIDNWKFKTKSVLEGLDYIFKAFHTLNASYPPEVEHIWLLIEKVLYGINSSDPVRFPGVMAILKDIQLQQN